jgi:hypothetical protein
MFHPYNNPYSARDPITHLPSMMPPELVSQLMYGGGGMGGASYGSNAPIHIDIPRSPEIAKMIETLRKAASTKEGTFPVTERAPSLLGEFENLVFLNLNGLRAQTTFKVSGLVEQLKSSAFTKVCVLVESSAASEGDKAKVEGELARSVRKNLLAPPLKALWNIADYINARRKGMGLNPQHAQSADAISQIVSSLKVPYSFSVLSETHNSRLEELRKVSVFCNQRLPELLASSVGSVTPEMLLSATRAALMADTELLKAREQVLAEEIKRHLAGSGKDTLFVVLQAPAHRTIRRQVGEGSLSLFNPHSLKAQKHLPAGFSSLEIPSAWDQKVLKSLSGASLSSADIARALLGRLLSIDSRGQTLESEALEKLLRRHKRPERADAAAIYSSAIAASMKDDDATEVLWNACNRFHILSQSPFLGESDLGFSLLRHLRMYIDHNVERFGEKKK